MPVIANRLILTLFCMVLSLSVSAADLTASVDRNRVAANESFTLTLRYQGQAMSSPDFSPLEKDFDILSRQQQSQLSLGFGSANESTTEWVLGLMPKGTGILTIPPIAFKGEHSQPINIQVAKARASSDKNQPIFVETQVDTDNAYVQSQVIYTLRLTTTVRISSLNISDLTIPDAQVVKIEETQYQKRINGQDSVVVELKYAVFPEKAGNIEIPSLRVEGVVPDQRDPFGGNSLFGSRGKTFLLNSESQSINVKPIPENAKDQPWMPTKGLSISQRWSDRSKNLTVGEPITRSITVTAQGLTGAQITPFELDENGPFKLYPDQPDTNESVSPSGVLGTRTESVAIVPTEPGELTLPEVVISWWDTGSNVMKKTRLEPVTLTVDAAPPAQTSATTPAQSESPDPETEDTGDTSNHTLLTASLIANGVLLLMLFAVAASGRRRQPPSTPITPTNNEQEDEKKAFSTLKTHRGDQPEKFRQQILTWARLFWRDQPILCLHDVAMLSGQSELKNLFANLDNSLYGNSPDVINTETILAALEKARRQGRNRHSSTSLESTIEPLYPLQSRSETLHGKHSREQR